MGKIHQLSESKKSKIVHPLSRKAKQLSKKVTRDAKMVKKKTVSNMRLQLLGDKLMWFKENFDSTLPCYTDEQINDLIERYIDRHREEIEQINLKNNIGHRKFRQHASREDLIQICKETEMREFTTSGFETVDLTNMENVNRFKKWNGEIKFLGNMKLRKFLQTASNSISSKTVAEEVKSSKENVCEDISMDY
ncbi:UNVERIFIED_CONTAM: hypothetical protein RMT77_001495 [Armadillidium vulgare]